MADVIAQSYAGNELDVFALASNWKAYYTRFIAPCFGRRVLEVGAGLGATTAVMCDGSQSDWLCLEPDPSLVAVIDAKIHADELPRCCRAQVGTVSSLDASQLFDSIVYIDVLEHIEDDARELHEASLHLSPGGRLIVLSPAYQFLYSPFDRSIGHFRRYTRASLAALTPESCRVVKMLHLDSLGVFTSLANRVLLHQDVPTEKQILFWDRRVIPVSKIFDWLFMYRLGRSVIGVWERM
jgi:2-polyprenyl-3-methyl-5-hydroxy-6-metoxy-1,4-benzoquinol methylase